MKVRKRTSQNSIIHDNRGTTMLETLVAFVVLMVILGVLYNIIAFCSELRMSAVDMNRSMQKFSVQIYNNNPSDSITVTSYETTKTNEGVKKPLFYLELSDSTNPLNNYGSIDESNSKISLYNLNAKSYVYDTEGDTRGITPKAVRFIHKKDW